MKRTHKIVVWSACAVGATLLAGCAANRGSAAAPDYNAMVAQMMASSFSDKGIAKVDRLQQDASNAACSQADAQGVSVPADVAERLQAAALKSVQLPSDGKFLGDWKAGEKLAQNGRGMTWTDASAQTSANGGNCYNCHQMTKEEISFGTIGPSLYQYGKLRGVSDPNSAQARPMLEYTWTKIWNAKAYNACSGMPRFGHAGLLDEPQIKDLMALLLDPKSPVNQ